MKYADYLKKSGLTNKEVVALLNPHFPKFTKIQCSMLCHPEEYGVQLTAKARALLPALSSKPRVKRSKPNRLVVYLNESDFGKVKEKMSEGGFETVQSFMESLLQEISVDRKQGG